MTVAVLTGDRIIGFFLRKCMAVSSATKKIGRINNETTVSPRWPQGGFHCITFTDTARMEID